MCGTFTCLLLFSTLCDDSGIRVEQVRRGEDIPKRTCHVVVSKYLNALDLPVDRTEWSERGLI